MKVTLKNYPMDADALCGLAASICTKSSNPEKSRDNAMASGHYSILEHAAFTFVIEGVSRALLAQLTRHRIASFSVESQRYVVQGEENAPYDAAGDKCFPYVTPLRIREMGEWAMNTFDHQMRTINSWYKEWREAILEHGGSKQEANEDARFVLPNAAETKLMMTMNASELLHVFGLRCCNKAQWEIRELAWRMLLACKEVAPKTFAAAGPGCVRGHCPEKRSCGRPYANMTEN